MDGHGSGLLTTLVASLAFAFAGGMAARALRLPPLVGYLMAGVLVGPFTPGFVADQRVAAELAEIGVALLLFGVGLHFSPRDLWRARRIAVPGALVQIALATAIGYAVGRLGLGLAPGGALVLGVALSIASTAAATRALADRGQLDTPAGRIALGWLVVQDVVVILALVLLPLLADRRGDDGWVLGVAQALLQVAGFAAVMMVAGRRLIPGLLGLVARTGSRELFTLAVVVTALGIAVAATKLFGISPALGAFVAGVVLGESDLNHQAAAESLPLQQVFTVLFFVSIGMLLDPMSLLRQPAEILLVLAAAIAGTGLATLVILLAMRVAGQTAALVGAAFAQLGEFSFILTELAVARGLIGPEVRTAVLAVALLSIVLNPLSFRLAPALAGALAARWPLARLRRREEREEPQAPVEMAEHAILVGHGRVGQVVAQALRRRGLPFVVVEADRTKAERIRRDGTAVIYGDATRHEVLDATRPGRARLLVVALPDAYHARRVIEVARRINPAIETVVRTHSDEEARYLDQDVGVGLVVMGEREVAFGMTDFALQRLGLPAADAQAIVNELRAGR